MTDQPIYLRDILPHLRPLEGGGHERDALQVRTRHGARPFCHAFTTDAGFRNATIPLEYGTNRVLVVVAAMRADGYDLKPGEVVTLGLDGPVWVVRGLDFEADAPGCDDVDTGTQPEICRAIWARVTSKGVVDV